jgi:hypothetical protein
MFLKQILLEQFKQILPGPQRSPGLSPWSQIFRIDSIQENFVFRAQKRRYLV